MINSFMTTQNWKAISGFPIQKCIEDTQHISVPSLTTIDGLVAIFAFVYELSADKKKMIVVQRHLWVCNDEHNDHRFQLCHKEYPIDELVIQALSNDQIKEHYIELLFKVCGKESECTREHRNFINVINQMNGYSKIIECENNDFSIFCKRIEEVIKNEQ